MASRQTQIRAIRPQPSLADRAAEDLRRAIRDGLYADSGRLPSEPELARQLGVSRATLRQAVSALQDEGLLARRHGSGTYVLNAVAAMRNNLNVNFGVTDLIEAAGWRPGTRDLRVDEVQADARVARALGLPPRSRVTVVTRTRTADDRPVAYTVDYVPTHVLAELGISPADITQSESLYRGLERVGLVVHHGLAEIRPVKADRLLAAELGVRTGALLLQVEQVDYTGEGDAIVASDEYYVSDTLRVQVYRKGSGTR